jgi:hypothetical protein
MGDVAAPVHGHRMTRAFAAAAADLILDHGPLTLDQLHALAVERGLTRSKTSSSLRYSLDSGRYVLRPDGRYDAAARLLGGQVFTTRLRRSPGDGVLWTYRDLDPLVALPALPLAGGGELRRGAGDVESWTGPGGWLPDVTAGKLLGLRWDGHALHVSPVADVRGDSDSVRDVREVLGRHARASGRRGWSYDRKPSLTQTVLGALVEDPELFRQPLPPLRELLPLPEDLRPQDARERDSLRPAEIVEVPLPLRVYDELCRRADLLGEGLPEYLSLLLGAAADRVALPAPRYDRYVPYVTPQDDDAVPLDRGWR